MEYEAFIFDLDGTLVETTAKGRYAIIGGVLNELGVTASNADIDAFWFGLDRAGTVKKRFGVEPALFFDVYHKHDTVETRGPHVKPYEDVGIVQSLKVRGYKTGIVSGVMRAIAEHERGLIGHEHFDITVLARTSEGSMPKPHPHGLVECLKMLGVQPQNSIYVGNAEEDVLMARAAGVHDVLIDRDEHTHKTEASMVIRSLYELSSLFGR